MTPQLLPSSARELRRRVLNACDWQSHTIASADARMCYLEVGGWMRDITPYPVLLTRRIALSGPRDAKRPGC